MSVCVQIAAHTSLDTLLGLDVDPSALRRAGATLASGAPNLRTSLVCANYSQLADASLAAAKGWGDERIQYDGILMDLGCSSMQLDQAGRGFRYASIRHTDSW
jgi:16S rRNA C1402 N4-methylase RsmH